MLTRWNDLGFLGFEPGFAALTGLRDEMERAWKRFESEWSTDAPPYGSSAAQTPLQVRLVDNGDDLQLMAELPGFAPDDLQVSFEQGTLVLRGERKDEVPAGYSVHHKERGTLGFARAFTLPVKIDPERIVAKLRDGMLELKLPKAPEERPRTIAVQTS